MPKGGAENLQRRIDEETRLGRSRATELQGQLQPQYNQFWQNYNQAVNRQTGDYGNIMGRYNEFADTGGFSPQDISNIRARSVSPLRASYAAAGRNVARQRSLQGGYSPGYGVLQGRLAREGGQAMSDATRAAEGDIAEMRQRGRLAGISGLLSGYGATPGQASLYGGQALQGMGQQLDLNQAQNQLASAMTSAQGQQAQMPGRWQTAFNNILGAGRIAGGLIYPWMMAGNAPVNNTMQPNYIPYQPSVPMNRP